GQSSRRRRFMDPRRRGVRCLGCRGCRDYHRDREGTEHRDGSPGGKRAGGGVAVGDSHMPTKVAKTPPTPVEWRIGEVAKLTGVTTRTLRYWEELGLLQPSSYRASGERLYSPTDVARVTRIRNLQELLGFSLAEVRTVLNAGDVDVLDRVRSELKAENLSPSRHREL